MTQKNNTLMSEDSGVSARVFALVFPVFLFFFLGICEFAMIRFGMHVMETSIHDAARSVKIGCVSSQTTGGNCTQNFSVSPQKIINDLVTRSFGFIDANNPERFRMRADSLENISLNHGGDAAQANCVNFGNGGEDIVFHATYRWPNFFPVFYQGRIYFPDQFVIRVDHVIRNEPFTVAIGNGGRFGGCLFEDIEQSATSQYGSVGIDIAAGQTVEISHSSGTWSFYHDQFMSNGFGTDARRFNTMRLGASIGGIDRNLCGEWPGCAHATDEHLAELGVHAANESGKISFTANNSGKLHVGAMDFDKNRDFLNDNTGSIKFDVQIKAENGKNFATSYKKKHN